MNTKYKIPAIVLGMSVNGLGVVRSLGRAGVKVYALDSDTERTGMTTRYASCLICPDVQTEPKKFKEFLLNLVEQIGGKAILFPTSDNFNEFVHHHRDELKGTLKFAMPPAEIMDKLLDKKGQYELAKAHAVPMPKTYFPQNDRQIADLAEKLEYPVIFKGLSTGSWRNRFGDKKAVTVYDKKQLVEIYHTIHDIDHVEPIIQEIIPGDDSRHYKICVYMDSAGKPVLTFTLQKIRQYPCDFGIGSSVISKWVPQVAEMGIKFLQEIGYYGVGSIEFKKDSRDEQFKMIEVNARLWAQNSLPEACGQNFALTAYLDILGEKAEPKIKFQEGVKWISLKTDRASFLGYLKQGRMNYLQWLASILTGKRVWAVWALDDPRPFFKEIKYGFAPFEKVWKKGKKGTAPLGRCPHASIQCDIINKYEDFQKIRNEWNDLVKEAGIESPFLRHEWLSSYWQGYGHDKELFIVRFSKDKETVGFAPLMKYKTQLCGLSVEAIGFVSNHWTRMDFLFKQEKDACLNKLAELLKATKNVVILAQMNTSSYYYSKLAEILRLKKINFAQIPKMNSYIQLEGSWEEYLKNQSRNFRQDYHKKLRRLEKKGNVALVKEENNQNKIINQMSEIAKKSWQSQNHASLVTTDPGKRFYQVLMQEWPDKSHLDFSFLQINEEPISYMMGVQVNGTYFAFDTAYNQDYREYSPGVILHNLLMERLFANGSKRLDFGFIAEYKKRWSESTMVTQDITIFPAGVVGWVLSIGFKAKNTIKTVIARRETTKQSN